MFSYFGVKDWAKTELELETLLENQDYGKLLNVLYTLSKTEKAFEWAKKHEPENHVPILYFMIRERYLSSFNNYDEKTLTETLYWAFNTLMISMIHISECSELNMRFQVLDILTAKFQEKFGPYITQKVFRNALLETDSYFSELLEREYNSLLKAQPIKLFPDPDWIYTCDRGGWYQPALNCLKPVNKEQEESIASRFYRNEAFNFENHRRAFEQGMDKLNQIWAHYKQTGTLELNGGFKGNLLVNPTAEPEEETVISQTNQNPKEVQLTEVSDVEAELESCTTDGSDDSISYSDEESDDSTYEYSYEESEEEYSDYSEYEE